MTNNQKTEIINKLQFILDDFQMLRDGEWQPDRDSCNASIDNADSLIYIINTI